jgi:hypothetical protein
MTTELQKKIERGYVDQFCKAHPDWSEIVEGEKPDFRIRRTSDRDIGLEVVEYHADSQEVSGQKRVASEARWWKGLWPLLEQERQTLDVLRGVGAHLQFNEARIPDRRDHQALARELVQVIHLAAARAVPGGDVEVIFEPQATVEEASRLVPDYYFLPKEQWPLTSKNLSYLSVSRWPIDAWVPWNCLDATLAWVGPDKNEFARILEGKAKKAQYYDLVGAELWLLVVCETHGDVGSHIFPQGEAGVAVLETKIRETGFDFAAGPFAEVWLLSAFTGSQRRIHPLALSVTFQHLGGQIQ